MLGHVDGRRQVDAESEDRQSLLHAPPSPAVNHVTILLCDHLYYHTDDRGIQSRYWTAATIVRWGGWRRWTGIEPAEPEIPAPPVFEDREGHQAPTHLRGNRKRICPSVVIAGNEALTGCAEAFEGSQVIHHDVPEEDSEPVHVYRSPWRRRSPEVTGAGLGDRQAVVLDDADFHDRSTRSEVLLCSTPPRDAWAARCSAAPDPGVGVGMDTLLPADDLRDSVEICNASGLSAPVRWASSPLLRSSFPAQQFPQSLERQRRAEWEPTKPQTLHDRTVAVPGSRSGRHRDGSVCERVRDHGPSE